MRINRFTGASIAKATLMIVAAVMAAAPQTAAAQGGIVFSFGNLEVTGEGVAFDILAAADEARLGDTQVYLAYTESTFGTAIGEGGRITASLGDALAAAGSYGTPIINDNDATRVSLTTEFLGQVDEGVSLGGGPIVLLHVTVEQISNEEPGQVAFYEPLMAGQQYTSDLATTFTNVSGDGLLDIDVIGLLSPILLATTAGSGAVRLDWTAGADALAFEVQHAEGPGEVFRKVAAVEKPSDDGHIQHLVEGLDIGTHRFRVQQVDASGQVTYSEAVEVKVEMAEAFLLDPVYPNPFNPQATIRFAVKESEHVRMELYNALGQRVRILYDAVPEAGTYHEVRLDGSDLAGGLYIVTLKGKSFAATQRALLVK